MGLLAAAVATPEAETIRRVAREVIGRPEYRIDPPRDYRTPLLAWLLDLVWWLMTPLRWLFGALYEISPPLAWLVVGLLVALLVLLVGHILYSFRQALRRRTFERAVQRRETREVDPAEWERQAAAAHAAGDDATAVRLLFRASLFRLQRGDARPLRRGATNREVLRRYRGTAAFDPLRVLVETIDWKWYGRQAWDAGDYERCSQAHAQIRGAGREVGHADRA